MNCMECYNCGFMEDEKEKFVGIFVPSSSFSTTEGKSCGVYGCPKCGNVQFTMDKEYIAKKKEEYKNSNK